MGMTANSKDLALSPDGYYPSITVTAVRNVACRGGLP